MEIADSVYRDESGMRTTRRRKRPELLVWPSSSLKGDDFHHHGGFVVGWSSTIIEASTEAPRNNEWPVETSIVAGIIPTGMGGRRTDIPHEYSLLQSKIQKVKEACCSCRCGDASANIADHSKTCASCMNGTCFDELSILAYYLPTKDHEKLPNDLPVIGLSNEGFPWWSLEDEDEDDDEHVNRQRQLLVYTDSIDKEIFHLYSHSSAPDHSYFSRVLLSRLTHAAKVVNIISQDFTQVPTAPPKVSKTRTAQAQKERVDTVAAGSKDDPWNVRLVEFLQRRSLFLRHCESVTLSRLPLGLFIRSLRSRDNSIHCNVCLSCPTCHKQLFLPKPDYVSAQQAITDFDDLVASGLEAGAGMALGLLLAFWLVRESTHQHITTVVSDHYSMLRQSTEWLESFPIGFKLNEKLTENMGREVHSFIGVHEWFVRQVVSGSTGILQNVLALISLVTGVALGGSGLVALLFDLFRLATLHISVFAACFRNIYRSELYMLAALWRLFRGKKRNILRKRTDSMAYDYMQLLLGTLLFAIALFLFTTVLVYHAFFAVLNLAFALLSVSLFMVYVLIQSLPFGRLVLRKRYPSWFTFRVHIIEDSKTMKETANVGPDVTRLVPVAKPYDSIILDVLGPPMHALLSCCSALLTEFFTGVPCTKLLVETVFDVTAANATTTTTNVAK
jgi:hypothetical protein